MLTVFGAWLSYTEALYLEQQTREFGHDIPEVRRWLLVFRGLTIMLAVGAIGAISILI